MLVSYKWLQTHFKEPLPPVEKLVDVLTLNAYEIEEFNEIGDDVVIDVDVLPNRSHDSLCHRGIAREIAILLERDYEEFDAGKTPESKNESGGLAVAVADEAYCPRYIGKKVDNVVVGESPKWMKEYLEALGQRSINVIVDITNFVMLETGQPMHAFDADKLSGSEIVVRRAKDGEEFTTLDDADVVLTDETLVIADEKDALAIAGVKGGKQAEVDAQTNTIVLEAAYFDSGNVRKTARRIGIQTDSSKRFENEISPFLAEQAMDLAVRLVAQYASDKETVFYTSVDVFPRKPNSYVVGVTVDECNRLLGSTLSEADVESILTRLQFNHARIGSPVDAILKQARSMVGVPYTYGASVTYDAPRSFDCSSFTAHLFAQAGIAIPRMTIDQYVFGEQVAQSDMQPGDIIFSHTGIGKSFSESVEWMPGTKIDGEIDHCGLYLGDGDIIHASRHNGAAGEVNIEKLTDSEQFKQIAGIRRMPNVDKPHFVVTVPLERLDIRISPDLVEEVGRIHGYDSIVPQVFAPMEAAVNAGFYYENLIRNTLINSGYSEVLTYAFTKKGDVAVANPIASDKGYMRKSIFKGFEQSLDSNYKNADLLGLDVVRVFEIGTVFTKKGEKRVLGIGARTTKSYTGGDKKSFKADPKNILASALESLQESLAVVVDGETRVLSTADGVIMEIELESTIEKLPVPERYGDVLAGDMQTGTYTSLSPYPVIVRDVAVFVPVDTPQEALERILIEKSGELLARTPKLFDVFTKTFEDGAKMTSYAYRLVFQSMDKTLTDEEVNVIMEDVYASLSEQKGWEIR